VSKSASIVEINGNRYDAVSGQILGAAKNIAGQVKRPATGVIDGFVGRSTKARPLEHKRSQIESSSAGLRERFQSKIPRVRERTMHSDTLMRGAVKRPALSVKKPLIDFGLQKARTAAISPVRAIHAKTIAKNPNVKHFGRPRSSAIDTVAPSPANLMKRPARAASSTAQATKSISARPLPSMVTSMSHQKLERLLDRALREADAHKKELQKQTAGWHKIMRGPKWLSLGGSALVLLLLVGFFAWQNIPQVSMEMAEVQTHVSAAVPAYTPQGYNFAGPISTADNRVSISYKLPGGASGYTLTQQNSNWDSSSVAANVVPASAPVQTSQINGTTVYIYGNTNNAAWVNHGILFTLSDKANLSSDDILKIANSL
jgi:hypothetical protein